MSYRTLFVEQGILVNVIKYSFGAAESVLKYYQCKKEIICLSKKCSFFTIAIIISLSLFAGCGTARRNNTISYIEVCDTSNYREKKVESAEVSYTSFSLDKYYNVYAVSDGLIRKFSLSNVLKDSYEGTEGFVAPCWYEEHIYAYSPDGSLVKISEDAKDMTTVSSELPVGFALDIVVADNKAFLFINIYNEANHGTQYELWQVNLEDGITHKIEIKDVKAVYASEGGCVYATAYDDRTLTNKLYAIDNGEAVLLGELDIATEIMSFILENGRLYYPDYIDSYCIVEFNLNTLGTEVFVSNANAFAFGAMRFKNGNIIYIDSNTQTISSAYTVHENEPVENALIINDPYKYEWSENGVFNYNTLSSRSGIKCKPRNNQDDNVLLKIMAGDTDVDIYILGYSTVQKLIEKGIYTPIDSDVIREFNDGCFDYINGYTYTDSGELVLMPIFANFPVIVYPQAAADELGFTKDDLKYYDNFIEVVRSNYGGQRIAFTTGSILFNEMEFQYDNYYCDFANKQADYMTDEYKKLYSTLEGWQRYGDPFSGEVSTVPPYFLNKVINAELLTDQNNVLLFNTYLSNAYDDIVGYMSERNDVSGWRATPIPRISEKVTGNRAMVTFAFVNPYSERKDEAVKVLEAVADNYFKCLSGSQYSLIRKDLTEYPDSYYPDSELFNDFYEIAKNGAVYQTGLGGTHNDIEEYQNGRATLDEAIAMYQREVEIWLNE